MKTKDIIIHECVFCILDQNLPFVNLTKMAIGSEGEESRYVYALLCKYFDDVTSKKAFFYEGTFLADKLAEGETPFQSFVTYASEKIHDLLKDNPEVLPGNGIFVHANMDEADYIVFFKLNYQSKFICTLDKEGLIEWKWNNKVIPGATQKLEEYAFINLTDGYVRVSSGEAYVEGKNRNYLADLVLQLSCRRSEKEMIDTLQQVVYDTIKETYQEKEPQKIPQKILEYRKTVADMVEEKGEISLQDIKETVFADNEDAVPFLEQKMQEEDLPETEISVSKKMEKRIQKKQRIVTESGIEIIVPIEYLQDESIFEYVQDESGKISIVIKDIGGVIK